MADFDFASNCTLDIRCNSSDLNNITTNKVNGKQLSTFELGSLMGIVIAMLIDVLSYEYRHYRRFALKVTKIEIFNSKTVRRIIAVAILVLCLPYILVFFALASVYKVVCSFLVKRGDSNFVEFLDSFDVFWSLEDDATQSVINVLGVIESNSSCDLGENIKSKLQRIIKNSDTKKIFYRRNEKYGLYYWSMHNSIDMNEYVEVIEFSEKESLDEHDLQNLMTYVQNLALPYNNRGLFKIFITKKRINNITTVRKELERDEYCIIFRIHHSVGDGVALIELLCKTLADQFDNYPRNVFTFPDQCKVYSPSNILGMMQKLCDMPVCFIDGILREPDDNLLHKPSLFGKKVFKWTESEEDLFLMVKEIKDNVDMLNFTAVLLAALSKSLRNFFLQTMGPIPEDVAVVLPVRFPKASRNSQNEDFLKNDFSVTILDLPINEDAFEKVQNRCDVLRKSADPLVNFMTQYFTEFFSIV